MATDPAARPDYARRLWQLPTFLVGLACLWAVWQRGDRLRPSLADRYDRALQALRPAVDRSPPDVDQVQAALRKLPDATFQRTGTHNERGVTTLGDYLQFMVKHMDNHLKFIHAKRAAMGKEMW